MTTVVADSAMIVLPGLPTTVDGGPVIAQMLRRASSHGFGSWWRRAESVGFCAHPIQLSGADTGGRRHTVWTRCNNRRASVCPSCSDLYARDTWQTNMLELLVATTTYRLRSRPDRKCSPR